MKLPNGRTCSMVLRGLALVGACVLVVAHSLTAVAQQASARAVQGTDGNLYLVQGDAVWHLVPDQISDSDVAALSPSAEVDGTLGGQPTPLRAVQGSDGTLYLVQGSNSWTFVPDQISDLDLAALSPSGEVDGLIPNQFVVVAEPAQVAAPPPTPVPASINLPPPTRTSGPTSAAEPIIPPPTRAVPAPTATSIPASTSNVLCEADWSNGMNGWRGGRDWKTTGGMLFTDGSLRYSEAVAPFTAPGADYSLQADMQLINGVSTGFLIRGQTPFNPDADPNRRPTGWTRAATN